MARHVVRVGSVGVMYSVERTAQTESHGKQREQDTILDHYG